MVGKSKTVKIVVESLNNYKLVGRCVRPGAIVDSYKGMAYAIWKDNSIWKSQVVARIEMVDKDAVIWWDGEESQSKTRKGAKLLAQSIISTIYKQKQDYI
jgi:hypothetical protein